MPVNMEMSVVHMYDIAVEAEPGINYHQGRDAITYAVGSQDMPYPSRRHSRSGLRLAYLMPRFPPLQLARIRAHAVRCFGVELLFILRADVDSGALRRLRDGIERLRVTWFCLWPWSFVPGR